MEVMDYTPKHEDMGGTEHYDGVPSQFARRVNEQNRLQPKYCEPGDPGMGMRGEKRNEQTGP